MYYRIGGPGRTLRLLLLAIPVVLVLGVVFAAVFSARRALNRAADGASLDGQFAFTLALLDPPSGRGQGPGFETVATKSDFTTGATLAGDLYLAGPSGLTILSGGGGPRLNLRTGFELPVAPIVGVTVARLRGTSEPQVLLATSGAGLLLLEPNSHGAPTIRQLLPVEVEARDLTSLAVLLTGDLLLGTRNRGVLFYNGGTLMPLRMALPGVDAATLHITALTAVDSASFLVGTRNNGVIYAHAGTFEQATSRSGLPDDDVESIAVPDPAHAFVGSPVGTAEFDLATGSFRPSRVLAQGVFSRALAVDGGQLTVGTIDQGIQQFPIDDRPHLRRASISMGTTAVSAERVDAFLKTPDALYALADGTLFRTDGVGWVPALPAAAIALTDSNISSLAFAPDGTLYIGYFDRGVDLMSPQGTIHHFEDDHLFCINRLALDPLRHTIDAATANGLVLFDAQGRPRQTLTRRDGLISDHITDVAFTRTGIALATPAGITFLGASGAESLYAFQGLMNNHVYALASDTRSNQLLAGTLGGISILRAETVEQNLTATNSGLKHNWITALLVGTYGSGVETLDSQGRFAPIDLPAGTKRDLIINPNALFATSSHFYAGTLGGGLLAYSVASGRWSSITKGLPSLNVTAFAAHDGELYVGTENGLVRISEAALP
jgi:hypothetical protein